MNYVSRGGLKLAPALDEFQIEVKNRTVIDIGASTGGFTDCLLQRGAARVYAVDVGYGILDWKLRNDPRVVVLERTNIRNLTPDKLKDKTPPAAFNVPDLAVIDVSFISLAKVFPAVYNLLAEGGEVVALIKPQFEARREQVPRGGVIKDQAVRDEVVEKVKRDAGQNNFAVKGLAKSAITGAEGNIEYFLWLAKK